MESNPKPFSIFDLLLQLFNQNNGKIVLPEFAKHDLEAALNFLRHSHDYYYHETLVLYFFEIEYLLLWAWLIIKKSILHLNEQDIQKYIAFRLNPSMPGGDTWPNPRFIEGRSIATTPQGSQPFISTDIEQKNKKKVKKYRLSRRGIKKIMNVIDKFYNFLLLKGKIFNYSPLLPFDQEENDILEQQLPTEIQQLTEIQWQYCIKVARKMADDDPNQGEKTLFIIILFYWLYPHVIEMTARGNWIPQMNHFYKGNKQNWQLKVLDKKKKLRTIWVSHEMLEALKRYRTSRGLKPLPSILDTSPLLPNEKGLAITGESDIRKIVQDCFDKVIEELRKDKLSREADKMELATITDLRQTGILDDMRKRGFSQIQVQKKMGEDLNALSTYPYNDSQMKKRYESAKNKKLIERFEV